jgi:nicotinamide mononucleotide transporter
VTALEILAMAVPSVLLMAGAWLHWLPLGLTEVLGFVTGAVCVWLTVREHIWNWPVGLANNLFFFVLFLRGRLFADTGLQVFYFVLGVWGWWNWLHGGQNRGALRISRASSPDWLGLASFTVMGTWALRGLLVVVQGAAPFWDALTTVLSLDAQYLLCRKRLENWWFWIAADVVYVPLYLSRRLPLTSVLYAVFLFMCLAGLHQWRRPPAAALAA